MADAASPVFSQGNDRAHPFSAEEWGKTPESVQQHVLNLCRIISEHQKTITELREKIEKLEARLNQSSLMWFNRNGHYVKLNHQKGEVSDESRSHEGNTPNNSSRTR